MLYAHPVETSFNAALHRLVVERLVTVGHEVDDCDLYAEGFEPCLSREERIRYREVPGNIEPVRGYVERLRRAEALVLIFPVWNYGYPAILKGFFDRVFLPGVSFEMVGDRATPSLHSIRKLTAITSYGSSRLNAFLMGDPPRRLVKRVLRLTVRPGAPVSYFAHYSMNASTEASRKAFMRKVIAKMDVF